MKQTPNLSPLFWASGIILSIVLLSLNACHKQEVEPEPIICPEANFRMEVDIVSLFDTLLAVDTIFNINTVQFTASDLYETYEWRVGVDPRTWNDKELSLRFTDAVGNIPITFIGQRKVLEGCENASTEAKPIIDTLRRTLHVKHLPPPSLPTTEPYLYEGTWRGAFEDSTADVFDVRIIDHGPWRVGVDSQFDIRVYNFPKDCADYIPSDETTDMYAQKIGNRTYKHFDATDFGRASNCQYDRNYFAIFGSVYGTNNDSLLIYGFTQLEDGQRIPKIFRAKKIQ